MMTEQAIKLLHRLQDEQFDGIHGDERREALEMAVRALEQNLVKESGDLVQDLVNDCISRKMAIDEVKRLHDVAWANWKETRISANTMIDALKDLPSAQPQRILYANMSDAEFEKWLYEHGICNPNIHESIPCDVVPLLIDNAISELPSAQPVNYGSTKSDSSSQLKLNNDLISRQAVIDTVSKWFYDVFGITESDGTATIFKRLRDLPSARTERKKGRWINHRKDDGHNIADCDQCENAIQWFDGDEVPRYCCMCGADMRGESDE